MRQMAVTLRIVDEGAAGVRCYRLGMDIFLDATSSLKLLRASRRDDAIVLKPSDVRRATPPGLPHTTLDKLQAPALLDWLKVPESHNLDIIVPAAKDRVRCRQIDCRVYGHPCAEQPFLELSSPEPDGGNPRIPLLPDTHVYVLCAEEIALAMAQRLHRLEREAKMTHQKALLMLLKLCLELCGTYAHDPFDPNLGDVAYKTTPPTSRERLEQFVAGGGTQSGLSLLREVVQLVYDGSASPQESFLGQALFGRRRLGGLQLGEIIPNKQLNLDADQQQSIEYRTITPDFQMPRHNAVVEYNGSDHDEGDNPRIDHVRMLDYQTLAIQAFVFEYEDVKTLDAFMRSAARIVRVMSWRDGPKVQSDFERLRRNEGFRARQEVLFKVFRPWLR